MFKLFDVDVFLKMIELDGILWGSFRVSYKVEFFLRILLIILGI